MSNLTNEITSLNLIARNILVFGGTSLFILGIIGNSINIVVFSSFSQFNKGSTPIFLLFSFLGSQTTLLTGLLPQLIYTLSGTNPLVIDLIICKLRWFIGPSSATIALHCFILAAINQYLLTSRHIRCHHWITRRRAFIMCLFVIIYSLGLFSSNCVYYTHTQNSINMTQCDIPNIIAATYNIYNGLVTYSLLSIFVLSIFSFLTWQNIRNKIVRRSQIEKALTRLLLAQIIVVLLTSLGFVIQRMYTLYTRDLPKNALQIAQENIASSVFAIIGYIIHTFSFPTYFLNSKMFRNNILSSILKRNHRIEPTIPPNT
ncbi:hypothetical protein I4U23_011001 [Adineta vaga]|nr:hypothetical protein I4U23_011001 [Adineta vaga]